ncbi:Conserved_hypothetical protein [Hexamita inflata]|uniref:Uncharacterized protein n=1 Tax=Hexamita inflata TaxID=28002 RepID=A0AA86UF05_9EUKA|nr:Conserved hypothetical protein [Hexamita inflata]
MSNQQLQKILDRAASLKERLSSGEVSSVKSNHEQSFSAHNELPTVQPQIFVQPVFTNQQQQPSFAQVSQLAPQQQSQQQLIPQKFGALLVLRELRLVSNLSALLQQKVTPTVTLNMPFQVNLFERHFVHFNPDSTSTISITFSLNSEQKTVYTKTEQLFTEESLQQIFSQRTTHSIQIKLKKQIPIYFENQIQVLVGYTVIELWSGNAAKLEMYKPNPAFISIPTSINNNTLAVSKEIQTEIIQQTKKPEIIAKMLISLKTQQVALKTKKQFESVYLAFTLCPDQEIQRLIQTQIPLPHLQNQKLHISTTVTKQQQSNSQIQIYPTALRFEKTLQMTKQNLEFTQAQSAYILVFGHSNGQKQLIGHCAVKMQFNETQKWTRINGVDGYIFCKQNIQKWSGEHLEQLTEETKEYVGLPADYEHVVGVEPEQVQTSNIKSLNQSINSAKSQKVEQKLQYIPVLQNTETFDKGISEIMQQLKGLM